MKLPRPANYIQRDQQGVEKDRLMKSIMERSPWLMPIVELSLEMSFRLIAGSYTPFALVTLQGSWGWSLLVTVWSLALLGIARELRSITARPTLALYIGMGWIGVVAAAPMIDHLETRGLLWVMAGAVFYTVGTVFYVNRAGFRHAHGTWHLFVLGGTASHYIAIAGFVV